MSTAAEAASAAMFQQMQQQGVAGGGAPLTAAAAATAHPVSRAEPRGPALPEDVDEALQVCCVWCVGGEDWLGAPVQGGALFTRLNGSIPAFQSDECDPWHMHFPSILYMCHDWAPAGHL